MKNNETQVDALPELKAVRKAPLYEQIVDQIRNLIDEGKFRHGQQLPTERKLAEIFQVSRHPVREAIRILEEQGLLESRVGSGTYVITETDSRVVDFLARALGREKEKLSEVFEFRMMLEPQIAALAADNADTTDIEALERLVFDQQAERDSIERFFDLDRSFHLRLARATKNSVVLRIMERINDILAESRTESQARPERVATSLSGHRAVLAAVKRKNADEARRKMCEHLQEIEQIVIHGVDSHPRK